LPWNDERDGVLAITRGACLSPIFIVRYEVFNFALDWFNNNDETGRLKKSIGSSSKMETKLYPLTLSARVRVGVGHILQYDGNKRASRFKCIRNRLKDDLQLVPVFLVHCLSIHQLRVATKGLDRQISACVEISHQLKVGISSRYSL
jgi:hypothetical protein